MSSPQRPKLLTLGLFLLTLIQFSSAQSALFLLISPSAARNGMGQTGVGSPSNDPSIVHYNPAGGAIFDHDGMHLSYQYSHTNWLPGLVDDMYLDHSAIMVQIPTSLYNSSGLLRITGVTFGQSSTYLDAGTQQYSGPNGENLGVHHTYFSSRQTSLGVGLSHQLLALKLRSAFGFSYKGIEQHLLENIPPLIGEANNKALDWGFMLQAPIPLNFYFMSENERFTMTPTFGYSISNIGGKVVFSDPEQADPLPRVARLGVSLALELLNEQDQSIIYFRVARSAEDNLLDYSSGTLNYQSWIGDIDPLKNVLLQDYDEEITLQRGFEVGLGDVLWLRFGEYEDQKGHVEFPTIGTEIVFTSLMQWMTPEALKGPFYGNINRYLGLSYIYAQYRAKETHPIYNTQFQTMRIELKHLDELLTRISPRY